MVDEREQGREAYRRRAWDAAYQSLSLADLAAPLGAEDLERLATSAYLTGRDADFHRIADRAHHAHLQAGSPERAARSAFWLGLGLLLRGESAQASGWLARARRLIEGRECVEQGYLLLPVAEQALARGEGEAARASAASAVEIGTRFADADLVACARHVQGRALMQSGQVQPGLALLDEAMLAVVAGELSPIITGLIYCSVIEACQQVYASSRAREWTSALDRWCGQQPEMVAFTGACLVNRAEILQLHGAWPEAMEEASRARERFSRGGEREPPAAALYRQAEVHRLRGEFSAAEEAYRKASRSGWEPQPGLALLRMAEGRIAAAAAAMRRVVGAATDRMHRARLLPAHVEIMLAGGDVEEAQHACRELEEIAELFDTDVLRALAGHARGAVELAGGDARAALGALRPAFERWRQVEAPYEAARARMLMGLACRALGDDEASSLDLDAPSRSNSALAASRSSALASSSPSARHASPISMRTRAAS